MFSPAGLRQKSNVQGKYRNSGISPISNKKPPLLLKFLDNKGGGSYFGKAIYLSRSQILENKGVLILWGFLIRNRTDIQKNQIF